MIQKNSKYRISFIIPTYNSGKLLIRSVKSILAIGLSSFEIIVIDDGSTDNSVLLLKEMLKREDRLNFVRILKGEHNGAGAARNLGIRSSCGDYIMFVDADDCLVNLNYLRGWIKESKNSDLVVFSHNFYNEFINPKSSTLIKSNLGLLKENIYDSGPVSKLFRREFLNDYQIKFPIDIVIGEDLLFNLKVLQFAKKINFINKGIYKVIDNHASITHSTDEKLIVTDTLRLLVTVNKELLNFANSKELIIAFSLKTYFMLLIKLVKLDIPVSSLSKILFDIRCRILQEPEFNGKRFFRIKILKETYSIIQKLVLLITWYCTNSVLLALLSLVLRKFLLRRKERKEYII
ncbi:glycosyltransferase family 2 protein [Lactiplantibacillus plantarum]|uniref:glycosyltransferase family 2 protein n=1 Tax=Lactiplantibacillus plantarum TaxID=1590 RepID=UPI003F52ED16